MGLHLSLPELVMFAVVSKVQYMIDRYNWHRLFVSFWSSVSFVGLGAAMVIFGSTLLDIANHLSVGVGVLAVMFTCRALGAGVGSVGSGFVLDKFVHYHFTSVVVILLGSIASTAVLPFSIHIAMFALLMLLNGIAIGALDNGVHAVLMRLWGHESGPCMQVLHFAYAFGAFLAPLIAKHFIGEEEETNNNTSGSYSNSTEIEGVCNSLLNNSSDISSGFDPTEYFEPTNETDCIQLFLNICHNATYMNLVPNDTFVDTNCSLQSNGTETAPSDTSRFKFAYLISSSLFLLPLIAFVYFAFRYEILACFRKKLKDENTLTNGESKTQDEQQHDTVSSRKNVVYTIVLFTLLFLFMFIYVGLEASFGSLILTVAVKSELNFDKQQAAVLQSLFWGTFAFTRLISVTLVLFRVRSSVMIAGNLSGSLLASIIMIFYPHNNTAIWIGTAVLGMSYASIFPTTMTWMSENAKATGKATAVLNTAGTVGDLTIPTAFGALIAQVSPDSLIYGTFVGVVVSICIVVALFLTACLQKRFGAAIGSRSRSNTQYSILEEEIVEPDSVVLNDNSEENID